MVKRILIFIIVVVCFVVMIASIMFALYLSQKFPKYNEKINSLVFIFKNKPIVKESSVFTPDLITINEPAIVHKKIKLDCINKSDMYAIPPFAKSYNYYGLEFSLINNDYGLQCNGLIDRLNSDFLGPEYISKTWQYIGNWKIVTNPVLFADALLFINSKPEVVLLDPQTGKAIDTKGSGISLDIAVYPEPSGEIKNGAYVFSGRNQKLYMLNFEDTQYNNCNNQFHYSNFFTFDDETKSFIVSKLNTWTTFPKNKKLPEISILASLKIPHKIEFLQDSVAIFVFSPEKQDNYKIGLANEKGVWQKNIGFMSVFSSTGELLAVSIDYSADKPQIETHLDSNLWYYFVVGLFENETNPDDGLFLALHKKLQ